MVQVLWLSIHCVAHRLALAVGQASESIAYLALFKEMLSTLFYYFHNSAVRQSGLTAIQTILEDPVLKLKQAKDVRWLSHQAAVDALRRSIGVLTSLNREASEREDATASGLRKFILKIFLWPNCLCLLIFFHMFASFLELCKAAAWTSAFESQFLTHVRKVLIVKKTIPGKYTADLSNLIQRLDEASHHIDVDNRLKSLFDSQVKMPYIEALLGNVWDRFASIDTISAFQIFVPKQLPEDQSELHHYGVPDLVCLIKHYSSSPLQLSDGIYDEWNEFKTILANSIELKNKTIKET